MMASEIPGLSKAGGEVKHWEKSPLYQIIFAIDMAQAGVVLDDRMLWVVKGEENGNGRVWSATRRCGAKVYAHTLKNLRKIMVKYEEHMEKD